MKDLSLFYVYNKWNDLNALFIESRLSELLKFLKLIFDYFKNIIELHLDLNIRRNKIYDLLSILDGYFYDDLIFNNNLDPELYSQLENLFERV